MSTTVKKVVVTRKEAQEMYGVSEATLRRAEAAGTLRAKTLGGRRRYRVEDLDAWFDQLDDA
ncbi:helix-turn-helix domain-containing protein [Nocardioides sp.]|uniref:helix-turn-helix domain-containing protein n=1 Tax=Nocardioides sp. TaxID=35761 RepID=UPI0035AFFAA8